MKNLSVAALLLMSVFCISCNYRINKKTPIQQSQSTLETKVTPNFLKIYQEIIEPKCINCHDGSRAFSLKTYKKVFNARYDIYESVALSKTMPKNAQRLSDIEIALLKNWIDAGAPELVQPEETKTPQQAPPAEEAIVNWTLVKEQIFEPKCISCHRANNSSEISNFEDYETVKATIPTIYFSTVITDSMPPRKENMDPSNPNPLGLSREQKQLLSTWIIDGYKL